MKRTIMSVEETPARKRKRKPSEKKLLVTEKVEVRSKEDGFLGSWHPGVVSDCCIQARRIRYDNILEDDGVNDFVETVPVSPAIDGIHCGANTKRSTIRGHIRPAPPHISMLEMELPYGLCVDVYFQEAWWEGVIFDKEDNSDERRVFFPDLGDELTAKIDDLRITQDWDEISGDWQQRGTWLFLQLIDKYEQDHVLPVSIRQIWYDFQENNGFKKITEWTATMERDLWESLLLEVININLEIVVKHFFQESGITEGMEEEGAPCQSKDDSKSESKCFCPVQNHMNCNFKAFGDLGTEHAKGFSELDGLDSVLEHREVKVPSALPALTSNWDDSTGHCDRSRSSASRDMHRRQTKNLRSFHNWQSANDAVAPEIKFCPEAVAEYVKMGDRQGRELVADIRKHIRFLGWNIEQMIDDKNLKRTRYICPLGKAYFSIRQICLQLSKSTKEINFVPSQHERRSLDNGDYLCLLDAQPAQDQDQTCGTEANASLHSDSSLEAECHLAVLDWVYWRKGDCKSKTGRKRRSDLTSKAREYLTARGWTIQYKARKSKSELVYISPKGKLYNSLRVACKDFLKKQVVKDTAYSDEHTEIVPLPQIPRLAEFAKDKASRALTRIKDKKEGFHPTHILRSSKRIQEIVPNDSLHHSPRTVLSLLIDNNVILPRAKVSYRSRKGQNSMGSQSHILKEGRITRNGIKCKCCGKVYSLAGFGAHADSTCCRPSSACIFLKDGRSLLNCQMELKHSNKMKKSAAEKCDGIQDNWHQGMNDHICSICQYGGELILCDQCPSSFHKKCLGLKVVPDGDWFCPSCCCGICELSKFKKDAEDSMLDKVLRCSQCERKYHIGCLRNEVYNFESYAETSWFCSGKCQEIYLGIHKLLGRSIPVGMKNLTWTLIKFMQSGESSPTDNNQMTENYCKLNVALDVMHECFETVLEPYTRRDLVEDVIFSRGSQLNRMNFQGFYTALLQKDDELITVATIRVHGAKVAEVPLVGTRFQYRRLGMCRILMNILEEALLELGVERMVLPAVPSVLNTWTTKFGFSKMTQSERLQFLDHTFLDFQDTIMCQKLLSNTTSEELTQSPKSQHELVSVVHERGDNMEFDVSSSVSDVCQAEQIVESGTYERRLKRCNAASSCSVSESDLPLAEMVKQPSEVGCEVSSTPKPGIGNSVDKKTSLTKMERSDGIKYAPIFRTGSRDGIDCNLMCYKRRKVLNVSR